MITQASSRLLLTVCLCFAALCIQPHSKADIIANFDAGNTSSQVDGYAGKAGDGWTSPWRTNSNSDVVVTTSTVLDTNPLVPGGGNYLQYIFSTEENTSKNSRVSRTYDTTDPMFSSNYGFSFDFRAESSLSDMPTIFLFDGAHSNSLSVVGQTGQGVVDENTWVIRIDSGVVKYYNGTTSTTTSTSITQGDTFRFTINVNPADETWTFGFENLTTPGTSYQSGTINFYTSGVTGGYLSFQGILPKKEGLTTNSFSIDNIAIIPEPGTIGLILISGLLGLIFLKRKYA